MPLSRAGDRERKRKAAALKREGSTVLLRPSEVRRLRSQGLTITKALLRPSVTLDDYRGLERRLEAKAWRVEQQRSDNGKLRDQVLTLQARLATLPAMEDTETKKRLTLVEAELAALYASLPMQRAEAKLDNTRRELMEEE